MYAKNASAAATRIAPIAIPIEILITLPVESEEEVARLPPVYTEENIPPSRARNAATLKTVATARGPCVGYSPSSVVSSGCDSSVGAMI
jgi:hypothetical protein